MVFSNLLLATSLFMSNVLSFTKESNDFLHGDSSSFILDDPHAIYRNNDYSGATPRLESGGRVIDLINGEFFDEHLRDTPDHMRPPSIVAIYDSNNKDCMSSYESLSFDDSVLNDLPSRAFLFAAKYDAGSANRRAWYKFIPERDLATRFGVNITNTNECPSIVYVPPHCNGFTQWCLDKVDDSGIQYMGCENYKDQCANEYKIWQYGNSGKSGNWKEWVLNELENSEAPQLGGPKLDGPNKSQFGSMKEQEEWLLTRDESTQRENYRNNWVSAALPGFSEHGYKAVEMSKEHLRDMRRFYEKWNDERKAENWNSHGQTAVNGHEVEPSMVSMDLDMPFRDFVGNEYIKPMLEEWVGIPLKLTSHYGIREYYDGSWLKNHIDRIDVLIISATQSIGQIECNTSLETGHCDPSTMKFIDWEKGWPEGVEWPLEGVDWEGNNVRYLHKPGTMVMYESAKFIHGRPYPLPQHPNHPYQKYVHLGAFCHFTPADGSWNKIGHPTNARNNLNRHVEAVGGKNRGYRRQSFKAESNYAPSEPWLRENGFVPSPVKQEL